MSISCASYERWQEPPYHELDNCDGCHEAGLHEDHIEAWKRECWACEGQLEALVAKGAYCFQHHRWYCEDDEHLTEGQAVA